MTDAWQLAVSLLGGATLAVLGGVLNQLWIDRRASRAAARLIFGEVVEGMQRTLDFVYLDLFPPQGIVRAAWETHSHSMSRTKIGAFSLVATQNAYMALSMVEMNARDPKARLQTNSDAVLAGEVLCACFRALRVLAVAARLPAGQLEGQVAMMEHHARALASKVTTPSHRPWSASDCADRLTFDDVEPIDSADAPVGASR